MEKDELTGENRIVGEWRVRKGGGDVLVGEERKQPLIIGVTELQKN